jgi:uncharacterized protein with FMN-binding domain
LRPIASTANASTIEPEFPMIPKRAVGALLTTVLALVLLFSFKTPDDLPVTGTTSGGSVAVAAPPTASPGSDSTSGSASAMPTATPTPATAVTPSTSTGAYVDGTVTGSVVSTRYGDVQVEVTISGGAIADVTALQLPDRDGRSQRIATAAEPILREEALAAQSANIDLLSGATYTSEAYAQSLQSALDQVGT